MFRKTYINSLGFGKKTYLGEKANEETERETMQYLEEEESLMEVGSEILRREQCTQIYLHSPFHLQADKDKWRTMTESFQENVVSSTEH